MVLPADQHVHTEWSWDTDRGAMDAACARAVALGIPAVAFTEHLDFTPFRAGVMAERVPHLVRDGIITAPALDVSGYLDGVERCRAAYPQLTILTGVEVGQPHQHRAEVAALLAQGPFDRILGSLHCLPDGDAYAEPWALFPHRPAEAVVREYLLALPAMIEESEGFDVLAHIDYPVRSWPDHGPPYEARTFEAEFRQALRSLARSGRALEINTRCPLDPVVVRWWRDEGGERVTFGSDAHWPDALGAGFADAMAMAEAHGFRAARHPEDPWLMTR